MGEHKQQQQEEDYKKKYNEYNISDLSKRFSEGKIKVYDYMTRMTTGNHQHAEAYKGLVEAQKEGLINDILLIKNNENYEFHGMLTEKGIEERKIKVARIKRGQIEAGTTYGMGKGRAQQLREATELASGSKKTEEEKLSNMDLALINNTIEKGLLTPIKLAWFNETFIVSSKDNEYLNETSYQLKEYTLITKGKTYYNESKMR